MKAPFPFPMPIPIFLINNNKPIHQLPNPILKLNNLPLLFLTQVFNRVLQIFRLGCKFLVNEIVDVCLDHLVAGGLVDCQGEA